MKTFLDKIWSRIQSYDYGLLFAKIIGRFSKCFYDTEPAGWVILITSCIFGLLFWIFPLMEINANTITFWLFIKTVLWMTLRCALVLYTLLIAGYELYRGCKRLGEWSDEYYHKKTGKYLGQ